MITTFFFENDRCHDLENENELLRGHICELNSFIVQLNEKCSLVKSNEKLEEQLFKFKREAEENESSLKSLNKFIEEIQLKSRHLQDQLKTAQKQLINKNIEVDNNYYITENNIISHNFDTHNKVSKKHYQEFKE